MTHADFYRNVVKNSIHRLKGQPASARLFLFLFVGSFFFELQLIHFLQVLSELTTTIEPTDQNNLIQVC